LIHHEILGFLQPFSFLLSSSISSPSCFTVAADRHGGVTGKREVLMFLGRKRKDVEEARKRNGLLMGS
jgi:hypothetical protein